MPITLHTASVGPWPMNTYVVIDAATRTAAVVDPGADAGTILALAGDAAVACILLTHAHPDHVGALAEVKQRTGAPVYLHPAEANVFGVAYDRPLADGDMIALGESTLRCIHTPGHTLGMILFRPGRRAHRRGRHALCGRAGTHLVGGGFCVRPCARCRRSSSLAG